MKNETWEKYRIAITLVVSFFLVFLAFTAIELKNQLSNVEEAVKNVSWFCEYMYPGLKDPNLTSSGLPSLPEYKQPLSKKESQPNYSTIFENLNLSI